MSRGDPFKVIPLGDVAVGGDSRILAARGGSRQSGRLSYRLRASAYCPGRRCEEGRNRLQGQAGTLRGFLQESRNGLGHDAALLSLGPPFNQHLKVELLGREAFEGVLADAAKVLLVDIPKKPVLEVGIAELARVVVPQNALDVCRGQDSPTTLKTASSSSASRISWSLSRSCSRTRPSMVFVATKLKMRQSLC